MPAVLLFFSDINIHISAQPIIPILRLQQRRIPPRINTNVPRERGPDAPHPNDGRLDSGYTSDSPTEPRVPREF
jgi:hypothetical protein